ncbi:MAG: MFS transporter [Thermomicrobiales bacterium]
MATVAGEASEELAPADDSIAKDADTTLAAPSGGGPPARGSALSAFQSRPFALFWSTIVLSLTGVWVRITAQGWLVYDLTEDSFLLGLASFFNAAPVLIFSPVAGAVLDRVDRRRVLLGVQLVTCTMMLLLATLVVTDVVRVWHIMAIAVVVGSASAFDWPARLSLVPTLVSRHQLQSAVALNAAAFNASRIVGPVVGGVLIGTVGVGLCFFLNAALYVPFVLVLATLSLDRALPAATHATSAFSNLVDGYRYIWRTPTIRGLLSIDIIPLAFGISYITLAPAVAREELDLGGRGLGALLAANGAGSLAGTMLVALLSGMRRRGLIVIAGIACFGVGVVVFGLSGNVYLSMALMLCLGMVAAFYGTMNDTLIQTNVDDGYRGRVLAVYSMFWGLTPIGSLEAGFLANQLGVGTALVINGMLVLCYVPILLRFTPVRRIE